MIYDEAVRDSAQVRVDLALAFMREEGIAGRGEVGDGDPLNAAHDVIADRGISEIIVSTLPESTSGWMRRDLIEALENDTGLPVKHVVVDLEDEGLPFDVTLVVANQTVAGGELVERLKALAEQGPHRFIVVVPQDSGDGRAVRSARERLSTLLESLESEGIVAAGMIGDPDPYTATMNAVQFFHISEIVISTLPEGSSKWMADKLTERVAKATEKPVEHVESSAEPVRGLMEAGAATAGHVAHEHHGPPPANRSSRVDPSLLGMGLFIISEVMVFGAFFTAYFFIRVVQGAEWPAEGEHLPKVIAGVNTAILISSSFTLHWAEHAHKQGNRRGLQAGILTTFLLGCTFLFIQINEYVHIGFSPQDNAQGTIFYGLTGLHGAHVFVGLTLLLVRHHPGVPRALHAGGPPRDRGARDLLALRRRDVDRRVPHGLHPLGRAVENPLRTEAGAFRVLLYVIAVAVAIGAIVLIVRAL